MDFRSMVVFHPRVRAVLHVNDLMLMMKKTWTKATLLVSTDAIFVQVNSGRKT